MYARAQRAHRLLAQSPDGKHAAAQRDLTGHGDLAVHRPVRQRREHRRCDGDAGARAVLGNGSLGEVNVNVLCFIEVRCNAELQRPLAQTRERRAAALLHHVAKVARQLQLAAAVHHADFNR